MQSVGVITEQNDLGLGWQPLSESDGQAVLDQEKKEKDQKDENNK
jgi:hypothetical protein